MNRRAKCDAASFILGRVEIRNRTNTHKEKQTHKQTVTDISTPCLSTCVDNKLLADIRCRSCAAVRSLLTTRSAGWTVVA